MKNEEIEIVKELVDELNFARQFLNDSNYASLKDEIKKLNEKIDNFKVKLDETALDETKEYIEKQKNIIEDAAKNLEAQKNFYINVLNQLKKENEEFINELQKNRFKTYFIIALASSASVVIVILLFILWGVDTGFVDYLRMLDAIIKTFSF